MHRSRQSRPTFQVARSPRAPSFFLIRSRDRKAKQWAGSAFLAAMTLSASSLAQETDVTQTPNNINAGIKKSFEEQVGPNRGDDRVPGSSLYLIRRDPFRSIARGRQLFQRKFTAAQGQGPRVGDGVGDFNTDGAFGAGLSDSCAGCHGRPRGSAGVGGNVFTRPDSRDAPHLFGLGLVEILADEMTSDLRRIKARALRRAKRRNRRVTVRLRSKRTRYGWLTAFPDGTVDTSRVKGVDADLRVKPFFAEGSEFSIRAFTVGALQAEMGLQSVDPDLAQAAAGARVVTPGGLVLDGTLDKIAAPPAADANDDPDGDGVTNEVPVAAVDHLEIYLLNYFKPGRYRRTATTKAGKRLFMKARCGSCHTPNLYVRRDRRVADVETDYRNIDRFNGLYAEATARLEEKEDCADHPTLKLPSKQGFWVKGIFSDFKRHDLGPDFYERNFDGTLTKEFMTEPLWGAGTTAPYGHDGRSINLREVILRHGGEAMQSRDRFARMSDWKQDAIIAFLNSLVLFGPPDTASNLNEGDPSTPNFPQEGHGSIDLSVLFNDPTDPE